MGDELDRCCCNRDQEDRLSADAGLPVALAVREARDMLPWEADFSILAVSSVREEDLGSTIV